MIAEIAHLHPAFRGDPAEGESGRALVDEHAQRRLQDLVDRIRAPRINARTLWAGLYLRT